MDVVILVCLFLKVTGRYHNEYYYNKYGRRIVKIYKREKDDPITGPDDKYPR